MIRVRGAVMATIKHHLSSVELEARHKTAADPIPKSHFHALWLLSSGREIGEVAKLLSFSTRWIRVLSTATTTAARGAGRPPGRQWSSAEDSDADRPGGAERCWIAPEMPTAI